MALRSRALQASRGALCRLEGGMPLSMEAVPAAGCVGCSCRHRRCPAADRLPWLLAPPACCPRAWLHPHQHRPAIPSFPDAQALAAQARAFSTQTEIGVVSGLPPLAVGRKVGAAAASGSSLG